MLLRIPDSGQRFQLGGLTFVIIPVRAGNPQGRPDSSLHKQDALPGQPNHPKRISPPDCAAPHSPNQRICKRPGIHPRPHRRQPQPAGGDDAFRRAPHLRRRYGVNGGGRFLRRGHLPRQ